MAVWYRYTKRLCSWMYQNSRKEHIEHGEKTRHQTWGGSMQPVLHLNHLTGPYGQVYKIPDDSPITSTHQSIPSLSTSEHHKQSQGKNTPFINISRLTPFKQFICFRTHNLHYNNHPFKTHSNNEDLLHRSPRSIPGSFPRAHRHRNADWSSQCPLRPQLPLLLQSSHWCGKNRRHHGSKQCDCCLWVPQTIADIQLLPIPPANLSVLPNQPTNILAAIS